MRRRRIRFLRSIAISLAATGWAGCGFRDTAEIRPAPPDERLCLVRPALTNTAAQESFLLLRKQFPGAAILPFSDPAGELKRCRQERQIPMIPECSALPMEAWAPLRQHLDAGGAAVLIGLDPFAQRVQRSERGYLTDREWTERTARTARNAEGFSSVRLWRHEQGGEQSRGAVRLARDVDLPWPGVWVDTGSLDGWDALILDPVPRPLFQSGENALIFYACGDDRTDTLTIECVTQNGARWLHHLRLTPAWTLYTLHEGQFLRADDTSAGSTPDDRLHFSDLQRIAVGLFDREMPQPSGDHTYGLSELRPGRDERTAEDVATWPDIPLVSPPYRYYSFTARELAALGEANGRASPTLTMQSPLPRPRGFGGERAAEWRWIPIAEGRDSPGSVRGWPVSIAVRPVSSGVSRVAWVGAPWTLQTRNGLTPALHDCLTRLDENRFLHRIGSETFVFTPGDRLRITSRWMGPENDQQTRIMAELADPEGRALRRVVAQPAPPNRATDVNLGVLRETDGIGDAVLRVSLLDPDIPGKTYDYIEQPVKLLPKPVLASPDILGAQGPFFARLKIPVFLAGVHYCPMSVNGRAPGEHPAHWLAPSEFDPMTLKRDLDLIADAGVNAVSVDYTDEDQAPQLIYFLAEAAKRRLRVQAILPFLCPLAFDMERAGRLIEAAHVPDQEPMAMIEFAWASEGNAFADRARWDGHWREWLTEQYGSLDHAERLLGPWIWPDHDPSDATRTPDATHSAALAAYRRFAADFVSRRLGYLKRHLRRLGCRQLLGARLGPAKQRDALNKPFPPLDPGAGAAHLDYISPQGLGIEGDRDRILSETFVTAYARGVSDGKPVAWTECGRSVGTCRPGPAALAQQAAYYRDLLDMIDTSRAAACFLRWYPGGFLVEDRTDFGWAQPDGTLRPAGQELQQFVHRQRFSSGKLPPWKGREMGVEADIGGLTALRRTWANLYGESASRDRIEEIRPYGFNLLTTEIPPAAPGGAAFDPPAPLACVNAEWGSISVEGIAQNRLPGTRVKTSARREIELELMNTGPARWAASKDGIARTVWVRAAHPERGVQWIKVPSIAFGKSARFAWAPPDPGVWTLRPYLRDVGGFGETLTIEVDTL